jgi:hypothetical protein
MRLLGPTRAAQRTAGLGLPRIAQPGVDCRNGRVRKSREAMPDAIVSCREIVGAELRAQDLPVLPSPSSGYRQGHGNARRALHISELVRHRRQKWALKSLASFGPTFKMSGTGDLSRPIFFYHDVQPEQSELADCGSAAFRPAKRRSRQSSGRPRSAAIGQFQL